MVAEAYSRTPSLEHSTQASQCCPLLAGVSAFPQTHLPVFVDFCSLGCVGYACPKRVLEVKCVSMPIQLPAHTPEKERKMATVMSACSRPRRSSGNLASARPAMGHVTSRWMISLSLLL